MGTATPTIDRRPSDRLRWGAVLCPPLAGEDRQGVSECECAPRTSAHEADATVPLHRLQAVAQPMQPPPCRVSGRWETRQKADAERSPAPAGLRL